MYILTRVLELGADAPTWYKNNRVRLSGNSTLMEALKNETAVKLPCLIADNIEQWLIYEQDEQIDVSVIEFSGITLFFIGITPCSPTQAINQAMTSQEKSAIVRDCYNGVTLTHYEIIQ